MVADLNQLGLMEEDLRRHLFGAERIAFPLPLRRDLLDIQGGRCFYCAEPLNTALAVDHFIPWSRWPNDAIENLVVAHSVCNSHKSDRIPGPLPLSRWADRLSTRGADLAEVAVSTKWRTDRVRTVSLARSLYAHLPAEALVWNSPERVGTADPAELLGLLAPL